MAFIFDIREVVPIPVKGVAILVGKLLEGKICLNDFIGVPLQDGTIIPGGIASLAANHRAVDEVSVEEGEFVEIWVSRLQQKMHQVALGRATNFGSALK